MNVFEILNARILSGNFKLMDMQERIETSFARGSLTAQQTEALSALAVENASKEGEIPGIMDILTSLSQRISALEGMEETGEAYPVWKPWDGISSLYQKGAVVSHNGKLYQSVFPGQNVWEPGVAGTESLWKEYEGEKNDL